MADFLKGIEYPDCASPVYCKKRSLKPFRQRNRMAQTLLTNELKKLNFVFCANAVYLLFGIVHGAIMQNRLCMSLPVKIQAKFNFLDRTVPLF